MFYVVHQERREGTYGKRRPNLFALQDRLGKRLWDRWGDKDEELLSASSDDIYTAVFLAGQREMVGRMLARDLVRNPRLLPNLLRTVAPVETSPDPGKIKPEGFEASSFEGFVPLEEIDILTRPLGLEQWSDIAERELVKRFREWMDERIIE